jgi:hypothetical protein
MPPEVVGEEVRTFEETPPRCAALHSKGVLTSVAAYTHCDRAGNAHLAAVNSVVA